jgi:hypothetical protein
MLRTFLAALLLLFLLRSADAFFPSCPIQPEPGRFCIDRNGIIHGHGSNDPLGWLRGAIEQAGREQYEADWREMNAFLRQLQRKIDRDYYEMQRACPQGRPPE